METQGTERKRCVQGGAGEGKMAKTRVSDFSDRPSGTIGGNEPGTSDDPRAVVGVGGGAGVGGRKRPEWGWD